MSASLEEAPFARQQRSDVVGSGRLVENEKPEGLDQNLRVQTKDPDILISKEPIVDGGCGSQLPIDKDFVLIATYFETVSMPAAVIWVGSLFEPIRRPVVPVPAHGRVDESHRGGLRAGSCATGAGLEPVDVYSE